MTHATSDRAAARASAIDRARVAHPRWQEELFELLRIPSVSTDPAHAGDCRAAAEWLRARVERAGLEHAEVLETGGHPVVYADWLLAGEQAPTVLVYGHYDVQPPDPVELWDTPPFEPTLRPDGSIVARGAADDKGQLYIHVCALEAMLAEGGTLPVNVKLLLEGEEESGSEHLEAFIEQEQARLACDSCLVSDTHMLGEAQPSIVASLRGMAYVEIAVHGPSHDLHSGTFGGGVRNPVEALAVLLASCKDAEGRITIPGFYDDVVEPSADDRAALAKVPFCDADVLADAGLAPDEGFGESGWTLYEQLGARPTFEVNGMWGGYTGAGAKTVLPAEAHAKVSMRLVAAQSWRDITAKLTAHLEALAADMRGVTRIEVTPLHGGEPSLVDTGAPTMRAASRALEQTFGTAPVFTREGGSIPVVTTFQEVLGAPTALMGFGLPDDRLHSPNEKFSTRQFERGVETTIAFWHELAAEVSG